MDTPLFNAISKRSSDCLSLINPKSILEQDRNGRTPIHMACIKGNEAVVKALVEAGVDVHQTTKKCDLTPINFVTNGPLEKDDPPGSVYFSIYLYLLEKGAKNRIYPSPGKYQDIHGAACWPSTELIDYLLGHETDVNAVDKDGGRTPLHYAASDGRIELMETIKYLISKGANISLSIKDRRGRIPLELVKDEREGNLFRNFLFEVTQEEYKRSGLVLSEVLVMSFRKK